jgi:hypothetical protein
MLAIHDKHDQCTDQMRNRLKTTGMGLGLVRLLLDAGRSEEARTTLSSLRNGLRKLFGIGKPKALQGEGGLGALAHLIVVWLLAGLWRLETLCRHHATVPGALTVAA